LKVEIAGGPEIDVTGPYVRVLIDGGGVRSNQKAE